MAVADVRPRDGAIVSQSRSRRAYSGVDLTVVLGHFFGSRERDRLCSPFVADEFGRLKLVPVLVFDREVVLESVVVLPDEYVFGPRLELECRVLRVRDGIWSHPLPGRCGTC